MSSLTFEKSLSLVTSVRSFSIAMVAMIRSASAGGFGVQDSLVCASIAPVSRVVLSIGNLLMNSIAFDRL